MASLCGCDATAHCYMPLRRSRRARTSQSCDISLTVSLAQRKLRFLEDTCVGWRFDGYSGATCPARKQMAMHLAELA